MVCIVLFLAYVVVFSTGTTFAVSSRALLIDIPPSSSQLQAALVPALFVLGDSSVDCGTNNYLGTLARADRPPYGRDFDTGQSTGRFSNGRIVVDYLALRLGLPFVPSYLSVSNSNISAVVRGVNYASAAAGILFASGSDLGMHVSLTQQVQQVEEMYERMVLSLGEWATTDLLGRSIFYVSIGSNDFIHFYLKNASDVKARYMPWEFGGLLVDTLKQELKNLHNLNVRKIVVMGLGPLGCSPHYLLEYGSVGSECIADINNVLIEFNYAVRYMVQQLGLELPGTMISFCDAFEGSMDILRHKKQYGFVTTADACCGLGKHGAAIMCLIPQMACSNASDHIWWDEFHPTDAVNRILADNVWSGEHAAMCFPYNLLEMARSGR